MRLRALSLALLILLLAACDPLGPIATPTPTTSTSPATATVPPIVDTPTIAADLPQPTDTTEATSEPTQAARRGHHYSFRFRCGARLVYRGCNCEC